MTLHAALKNIRYRIESLILKLILAFISLAPLSFSSRTAFLLGDLGYLVMKKRRLTALENLDRAFGSALTPEEKNQLARKSFRHMTLAMTELFLVSKISRAPNLHFTMKGAEHLLAAKEKGRGILLIISHIGSWEYLAFLHHFTGIDCSVVVKDIRNPYLDKLINDCRRKTKLTPVPKKNSSRKIFSILKENNLLAVLIDQWAGPEGLWIPFFGHPAATTSIMVRLAKKTGAAMIPARCVRTGSWRYEIQIDPEIPVSSSENWETDTTLSITRHLEEQIRRYPEQWTWGHKRWKKKPAGIREA